MNQLALFDVADESEPEPFIPDEIIDHETYQMCLYYPLHDTFRPWLKAVNEHLLDMTGYSLHQFANYPMLEDWADWPSDTCECALAVLSKDAWGQEFLSGLDKE
jgi:hypothetical protein